MINIDFNMINCLTNEVVSYTGYFPGCAFFTKRINGKTKPKSITAEAKKSMKACFHDAISKNNNYSISTKFHSYSINAIRHLLMLSILGKNSADDILEYIILFVFFPANRVWPFMQIVSLVLKPYFQGIIR